MDDAALESALRALGHRDRSARELERRLAERGFSEEQRTGALAALERTGVLDDVRFAHGRATSLAGRGAGDERIRFDLRGRGVDDETIEDALAALEPEAERARRIVARRGPGVKTARYLRGHGFAPEVVAVVAVPDTEELR